MRYAAALTALLSFTACSPDPAAPDQANAGKPKAAKSGGKDGAKAGKAAACRGTSVSDWHDLHGKRGTYQRHLAVYGRSGSACTRCGETIQRAVLGGRGTYFCPRCQPCHTGDRPS